MRAQDLAALAALGAVGYHLSKGKGKGKKDDAEGAVDASPEKMSRQENDVPEALSRQERDVPEKVAGGMRSTDVTQGGASSGTSNAFKKVKDKSSGSLNSTGGPSRYNRAADSNAAGAAEKAKSTVVTMPTGDDRFVSPEEGAKAYRPRRPGQTSAPAPTFSSSEAGMKNYVPRRTGQTPSAVQTSRPAEPQSMARYPGGLAKRGANVSVPEDKPITRILGTDQDYIDAMTATAPVGLAAKLAAKMAYKKDAPLKYYDQPALGGPSTPLLGAPAKQLTGPSKTDLMARDRANRASEREDAMTRENADRYGLNPNAPGYDAAASSLRDRLGGRDFTLKKKGGVIKKMASGGMTSRSSSASSRGDGIAQRGKTRGSMR
jgi:hypothetical protein